jgi:hypothetical protein
MRSPAGSACVLRAAHGALSAVLARWRPPTCWGPHEVLGRDCRKPLARQHDARPEHYFTDGALDPSPAQHALVALGFGSGVAFGVSWLSAFTCAVGIVLLA